MTFTTLTETAGAPRLTGKRWRVTVARPGTGSSGKYSADTLREYGPLAFPAGTKAYFNHDPKRDIRDMVGVYPDGAFWNEEDNELQADLEPFPRYQPVLAEVGPHAGASIRSRGRKDGDGNVVELIFDRGNSIDLVGEPGLEGSGLKYQIESLFEQARTSVEEDIKPDAEASAQNERKTRMEKMLEELMTAVTKLSKDFEAFVSESRSEVQGKADEDAVDAAVNAKLAERHESFLAVKEQIAEAKLTPTLTKNLETRALKGEDIAEALTEAKALVEEVRGTVTEGGEYVVVGEDRKPDNDKFTVTGWGK